MGRDSKIESQMMVILCHFPQMMIDDCHFQVPIFSPCVIITKKNDGRWHRLRCVDAELGGFEPPAIFNEFVALRLDGLTGGSGMDGLPASL